MALQIEINQDGLWNFFSLYDQLGPLQQQIWQRIVWYCNRYPNAHPTQAKIAKGIPCSRKHVNRTFALFKKHDWLTLISRGRGRAKTIGIPHYLLMIDLTKRQYSKRLEVTSKVTHSASIEIRTSRATGTIKFDSSGKRKIALDVAPHVQKMDISMEHKLKLSLCSEDAFRQALSEARDRSNMGMKIDHLHDYVVGSAIKIAQKRGEKLNWRAYYYTRDLEVDEQLKLRKRA